MSGLIDADRQDQDSTDGGQSEIVSRPVRSYRSLIFQGYLIAAVAGFAILAFLANTTAYFPIDLVITRAIQSYHAPWFNLLMRLVSWFGYSPQTLFIFVIPVVLLYWAGLHWEAVVAFVAGAGVQVLNYLIKLLVHRPRPTVDVIRVLRGLNDFSFPSGHVMFYTCFFGFLWYLAYTLLKRSWRRTLLLWILGGLIVLIGLSRIYIGAHWFSDVLGAYLLGSVSLALTILLYRWGKGRFFKDEPAQA